jgi:hypothetical protein
MQPSVKYYVSAFSLPLAAAVEHAARLASPILGILSFMARTKEKPASETRTTQIRAIQLRAGLRVL